MSDRFLDLRDIEQVQGFQQFLMGSEPPKGITLGKRPRKMTAQQAMALIYVLQEAYGVIPDCFELCGECGWIYDTEAEGHTTDKGKFFCDNCSPLCNCKDCRDWKRTER